MGIFQGWYVSCPFILIDLLIFNRHNVHSFVVGVPGACFGRYSSCASADESHVQALEDGTVQQLPV
jgi:hypothetical protein